MGRLAVNVALGRFAIVNLAGFLGEVGAHIVGILLHIFAQAGGELLHLLGVADLGAHALFGAGNGRRHDRLLDADRITGWTRQMPAARLLVERRTIPKPTVEFVPPMATKRISYHRTLPAACPRLYTKDDPALRDSQDPSIDRG